MITLSGRHPHKQVKKSCPQRVEGGMSIGMLQGKSTNSSFLMVLGTIGSVAQCQGYTALLPFAPVTESVLVWLPRQPGNAPFYPPVYSWKPWCFDDGESTRNLVKSKNQKCMSSLYKRRELVG